MREYLNIKSELTRVAFITLPRAGLLIRITRVTSPTLP
jgi:hypothetical protein